MSTKRKFGWKKFLCVQRRREGRRGLKGFFCGGAVSGSGGGYGVGGWLMA
jgi:hypothetical protein